jgi:PilZ domain
MTVAFEENGGPAAYGAVANLSEGGACVWTAAHFVVGQWLSLRLSATPEPRPLEAPAIVVWGTEDHVQREHAHLYGLRWLQPSAGHRQQIRRLVGVSP